MAWFWKTRKRKLKYEVKTFEAEGLEAQWVRYPGGACRIRARVNNLSPWRYIDSYTWAEILRTRQCKETIINYPFEGQ
jgi:hypothetical protein